MTTKIVTVNRTPSIKKKGDRGLKHRKTLVKEPGWMKLDDWYVGPEQKNLRHWDEMGDLQRWRCRLAHECDDGQIRAPGVLYVNHRRRGGLTVSAKCSNKKCKKGLNKKVQFLIQLQFSNL